MLAAGELYPIFYTRDVFLSIHAAHNQSLNAFTGRRINDCLCDIFLVV
jgi:hypothetical protein